MVDELIYSELAKSFGQTGHFLIRDVHDGAYGVVYPLLIASGVARVRVGDRCLLRGEDNRFRADVADRDTGVLPGAAGRDAQSLRCWPLCWQWPCRR